MLPGNDLNKMSQMKISEINKSDLVDIESVNIDTSLPVGPRMESYLRQIKNPYCFSYKGAIFRVIFGASGQALGDLQKNHFSGIKNY